MMLQEKLIVPDRGAAEPISCGAALLAGKKVAPDVINLLTLDHLEARGFFEWYARETDPAAKLRVATKLLTALSVHMQVEEEIFYPASEQATGDKGLVDHAREEHSEAKAVIRQLRERTTVDDSYDQLVMQLRQTIEHHVREEETTFFPKVRATGLDLFEVGRILAARRLELLFDYTGRAPTEDMMQTTSEMDVDTPLNVGRETQAMAVSPEEARKLFIEGLRNAHAVEQNCKTMVQRQIERLESYPKLKARLEQHLAETEGQIERLDTILEELGESRSVLKDAMMGLGANMSALMNAAAGDEILKNSMANAALAQFEIAAYKSLLILGEAAGEITAIRRLQESLNEERAMAAWLEDNLPGTVITHLQLRSQGEQSSH